MEKNCKNTLKCARNKHISVQPGKGGGVLRALSGPVTGIARSPARRRGAKGKRMFAADLNAAVIALLLPII